MPAMRLGLRLVKGMSAAGAERVVRCRGERPFESVQELAERAALDAGDMGALAAGGALKPLTVNRHRARWEVAGVEKPTTLFEQMRIAEAIPLLNVPSERDNVAADYRHLGLTLGRHPVELLRPRLSALGARPANALRSLPDRARVHTAGLVITRQRPGSAAGVTFVTLEDETGYANLVVWQRLAERQRQTLLGARLLGVEGRVQKQGEVLHVVAEALHDYSGLLGALTVTSRNFR